MRIPPKFDEELIKNIQFEETIVASALSVAGDMVRDQTEIPPSNASYVESSGARFFIPLAVPEGVASGDERTFDEDSITSRMLPLPLRWQIISDEGHKGSVVVGRIDSIERVEGGLGNARGVFDVGVYGRECERLVRGGFLRGVSVDVDKFQASHAQDSSDEFADNDEIKNQKIKIKAARLMGITVVALPAFEECYITLEEEPTLSNGDDVVEDGIYEEQLDDYEEEMSTLIASAAPVVPPRDWFNDPKLVAPTPITVEDEGRVFGHIALWKTNHIGLPRNTKPPRSSSQYAYFRTGVLRTDDGSDVQVGQLTLAGGHADMSFNAQDAVKHYDDTSSALVDVVAGEDQFGIWVSGALRPDATPTQVRALRASAPSGDWRPINNRLELVAVCQVNVAGFPVTRAMVASAGGKITALVAAGAAPLAELKENSRFADLDARIAKMEFAAIEKKKNETLSRFADMENEEAASLQAMAASAMSRMEPEVSTHDAELAAKVEALMNRFND